MSRTSTLLCCLALAVPFASAAAGEVRGVPTSGKSAEELIEEGARKIIEGIEILIDSIPVYGAPRIEENGDIIIPRQRPRLRRDRESDEEPPHKPPEPEET